MVYAKIKKKGAHMSENSVPISEKFTLTVREASEYFSIGIKVMRRLAEEHTDSFAVWNGNRFLIIRSRFEEYLVSCLSDREGGGQI